MARSTFRSQNVQSTPGPDHFWKLRCRKNARRRGAKHISKSKCTKHTRSGPLLEVEMSKKNARRCGAKHISKSKCTKQTRSSFRSQNVQSTPGPDHFWKLRCRQKCTPSWREAHFEVKMLITLLRVIPTMTFIHFLTGKSSGILSDISSGILSGISHGILSGISSGISSDILSDISSDILSGISSDILSGISSDILSDILSGILSGISSDILSDIFSDILPVEVRQCPLRSGSRG